MAPVVRQELVVHREDHLAQPRAELDRRGGLQIAGRSGPVGGGFDERLVLEKAVEEGAVLEGVLLGRRIGDGEEIAYEEGMIHEQKMFLRPAS